MTDPAGKPLILIVEDFDDAREMYREYLEFTGFRAETARDGREATRLLKADPDTSHLLIVALSAHALATEGDRARAAGCDGFIAKPCLPSDLVEEIAQYLKGQPASHRRP